MWVAVVAATLALPFLVIDNANSAPSPEVEVVAPQPGSPGGTAEGLLARRALEWTAARAELIDENVDLALALADQTRAVFEAQAIELAADQREKEQASRPRRATSSSSSSSSSASSATAQPAPAGTGAPTSEQWKALRGCESEGNYSAVSGSGRFRGAYQFSQATWDWVAQQVAGHLVGVDPVTASPAEQDRIAAALYEMRGRSQWPVCGYLLGP